jgi:hypothetical protein
LRHTRRSRPQGDTRRIPLDRELRPLRGSQGRGGEFFPPPRLLRRQRRRHDDPPPTVGGCVGQSIRILVERHRVRRTGGAAAYGGCATVGHESVR